MVGGIVAESQVTDDREMTFEVPQGLAPGTGVAVEVWRNGSKVAQGAIAIGTIRVEPETVRRAQRVLVTMPPGISGDDDGLQLKIDGQDASLSSLGSLRAARVPRNAQPGPAAATLLRDDKVIADVRITITK